MKIQFTHKSISEYYGGGHHFINDGTPIEVTDSVGDALLAVPHEINGETVPVFKKVAIDGVTSIPSTAAKKPAKRKSRAKQPKPRELESSAAANIPPMPDRITPSVDNTDIPETVNIPSMPEPNI